MRHPLPRLCALLWVLSACTGENPDAEQPPLDLSVIEVPDGDGSADMSLPPDGDAGTVAAECRKLATAACDKFGSCSPFELRYYYGDKAGCVARVELTCAPYAELNGSSWTIDRLRACTASYGTSSCTDYFDPAGPIACRPQAGKLADGAGCANSNQCQSAYCNLGVTGCGTCLRAANKGEACSVAKPCVLGLTCASAVCAASGGVGAMCGTGKAACQAGLYCKGTTCAKQLQSGETCNSASTVVECDFAQGLFCNGIARKCEVYKLAAAGEVCGTVMASTVLCDTGGTCSVSGMTRKCSPAAKEGQPCGPAGTDDSCELPAACTSNTCQVFNPTSCK